MFCEAKIKALSSHLETKGLQSRYHSNSYVSCPTYALSHLVTEMNRLFLSVYPFRKETPRRVQLSESAVLHLPAALCKIPAIIYYSFSQSLYIQIFTTKQEYFIIFNRFVKYRFHFLLIAIHCFSDIVQTASLPHSAVHDHTLQIHM